MFFSQVALLVILQQEVVHLTISAQNPDLFWLFFAAHDCYLLVEALNAHRVGLVGRKFIFLVLLFLEEMNTVGQVLWVNIFQRQTCPAKRIKGIQLEAGVGQLRCQILLSWHHEILRLID